VSLRADFAFAAWPPWLLAKCLAGRRPDWPHYCLHHCAGFQRLRCALLLHDPARQQAASERLLGSPADPRVHGQQAESQRLGSVLALAAGCLSNLPTMPASRAPASSRTSMDSQPAAGSRSNLLAGYCELVCGLPLKTGGGVFSGGSQRAVRRHQPAEARHEHCHRCVCVCVPCVSGLPGRSCLHECVVCMGGVYMAVLGRPCILGAVRHCICLQQTQQNWLVSWLAASRSSTYCPQAHTHARPHAPIAARPLNDHARSRPCLQATPPRRPLQPTTVTRTTSGAMVRGSAVEPAIWSFLVASPCARSLSCSVGRHFLPAGSSCLNGLPERRFALSEPAIAHSASA
jgi:hypothetical protein